MWIPTYDADGDRSGKVNTVQIVTVFAVACSRPPTAVNEDQEEWWEVEADTMAVDMSSVRITPHRYPTHQDAIDHIDELDWNEPHRCK